MMLQIRHFNLYTHLFADYMPLIDLKSSFRWFMLPSTSGRLLNRRIALPIWTRLSRPRLYATHQKSSNPNLQGTFAKPKRPAHVAPKDWRRAQKLTNEQAQLQQGDSPEVVALKTRLLDIANHSRIDLDDVDQVETDLRMLQQKKFVLSLATFKRLLHWCCRALVYTNRQLLKDKRLAQDPDFQRSQTTLQSLIEEFIAQYKQGSIKSDPTIPALLLSHYNNVGEFEKAAKLWKWLSSMKEKGHQGWVTYAARIDIAATLDEGYDVCKVLFEEALDTLGDPLIRYYVSDNSLLPDPTQPAPKAAVYAIPLLRSMLSVRLKYGHWREAYLGLDTILRLDPTQLWRETKSDVLASHTSWEAFLIECLEVQSGGLDGFNSSVVIPWLSQLVALLPKQPEYQDVAPARLYSVACTILESLKIRYQAQLVTSKGQPDRVNFHRGSDFADLKLLWTCWSTLNRLNGGKIAQDQNDSSQTHDMVHFITWMLQELQCEVSKSFQAYIQHDNNAIAKLKGNSDIQETTSILLSNLCGRLAQFRTSEDKTSALNSRTIPFWSDLFTRDEMFALYQEMGFSGEVKDQAIPASIEASQAVASHEDDETRHPEFVYETATGLSFAEARFGSWWMINNLYLAADAFEQADCLYPHKLVKEREAETATKQAEVLEAFSLKGLPEEERKQKKQVLLEFVRDLRRHQGEAGI